MFRIAEFLLPGMKKVLIFSTAYLPMIGGAEIAVKEITDRLGGDFSAPSQRRAQQGGPASGWEFDLICARIKRGLPKQEKIGSVNVFRVGWGWGKLDKFLLPWRGAALAAKLHAVKNYDLIWAIMASFGGLAALRFKLKHSVIPYLLTLQEGDSAEHIARRARFLAGNYKKMFTTADYISAISQYLKDFALAQGAKSQIEIVPNGVDINKFQFLQVNKPELKSKLGILIQEKIIITVSRLVPKNGVADLIEAVNLSLIAYRLSLKLLILGSGPLDQVLKNKVKELKLEDRVLFMGDVPNEQVPQYLALADVFIRPSLTEGLGNAFLEAMAAGVPIIGTRVGGIPDFLKDGETGFFCEVRNPSSIAQKISYILDEANFEEVRRVKESARQLVSERYSWNKIAAQMKGMFDDLTL